MAFLFLSGQAMAQTGGFMQLGASFPLRDYADFEGFNEFALTSADETDGGAAVGFNAGFKWYFNVGVKGLGVMLSLDGFYNGSNSDLKTAYRKQESSYDGELINGSLKYNVTPKYVNVPAMLGMHYFYRINPQLAVYAETGIGGNLRFITDMEAVEKGQIEFGDMVLINRTVKTTQSYDNAFSFAYQVGIGIEVAKNLVISCSFYDLGEAEVKGDWTAKTTVNNGDPSTKTDYKTYGSVRPMMILGRVGFSF